MWQLNCIQLIFSFFHDNTFFFFTWQKYIILAFALLILLAVIALIVGLSVGLTKPPVWELLWLQREVTHVTQRPSLKTHPSHIQEDRFLQDISCVRLFLTETPGPYHVCGGRFTPFTHHYSRSLWVVSHTLAAVRSRDENKERLHNTTTISRSPPMNVTEGSSPPHWSK